MDSTQVKVKLDAITIKSFGSLIDSMICKDDNGKTFDVFNFIINVSPVKLNAISIDKLDLSLIDYNYTEENQIEKTSYNMQIILNELFKNIDVDKINEMTEYENKVNNILFKNADILFEICKIITNEDISNFSFIDMKNLFWGYLGIVKSGTSHIKAIT